MRFQHKLMWKSKQRKSEEVENAQPRGVLLPVVQPVAVESRALELMFLEDMSDAHYSLPVPRGVEDRFTACYLQTFESDDFVFEFKQFEQFQTLVKLVSHQTQFPAFPLLDKVAVIEASNHQASGGSESDNSVVATLVSSLPLVRSDTIEDIYDFYATEIDTPETTLVDPSILANEVCVKSAHVTGRTGGGEDDKNTTYDNFTKAHVSESLETTFKSQAASPNVLAVVQYQPICKLSPVINTSITPRRLRMSDFIIVALLGQGGFGTVLLVFDTISRRFFALKVILKSNMNTKEMQYVFEEQRIGRALSDSKLLMGVAGSWEDTKNFFMLMPFAAGGDLGHHIRKHGPLSGGALAVVIPQLILAVEEMHDAWILNRDLKPANILLDTSGVVTIADFGLSVAFGVPCSDRPWKHKPASDAEGDVCEGACGTPGYMAPEVIRGGKYSYPADIFSLGCVFYELLFGCLPFGGYDDLSPIAERYCTLPLEFPVNNELDPNTQDLLTKMLDKSPTTRITSSQIKEHPAFANTNWATVANGQISASVRDELFQGTRPEDFDMSQAPSPPSGKPYEDTQEPHPWFHFAGPALTGPPANPLWVPTPRTNPNSTNLSDSRSNSHLGPFGCSGNVSIPRNLAVINGWNLMSSDEFGAQVVMNASNLMSSDDEDGLEPSDNPATPTTPAIMLDLEITSSVADDECDDSSMASECAVFMREIRNAKLEVDMARPNSRRILLG